MKESNKYKFVVLSDLHLPIEKDNDKFENFLSLLEKLSKKVEKIILLGDIFAIWAGISLFNHENGEKLMKNVEKLSNNCDFYFIEGNYDFYICKKYKKYFKKCSENYISLKIDDKSFLFTHGHLYTTFKDRLFMGILKSSIFKYSLEHKLVKPMVLKMQKKFEEGKLSRQFSERQLMEFTNKLKGKFSENFIICGHFHTSFQSQNVTITPDYYSKNQFLSYDGKSLKVETKDSILI